MDDIDRFLYEDLGDEGDITSDSIFTDERATARMLAKDDGVVAGLEEAKAVFERLGSSVRLLKRDGGRVVCGERVLEAAGLAKSILSAERLALNFVCHMSGIATATRKLVDSCKAVNPHVAIAATRKTIPGIRKYQKKAVIAGGGDPHRMGLYDVAMIKDNHIVAAGSVERAILKVRQNAPGKEIEAEVENLADALTAARLGVEWIMLDNRSPEEGAMLAKAVRAANPKARIEVSGGITPQNITAYASYPDRISLGYLTHTVRNMDFSLEIDAPDAGRGQI
ncbi:MAG: nicotinate-nucleotide diphosphorylase (carboxylating) [Thermoplasmata archaeon HGW-Thermoplasmata-1]|nr:MAG: nicotinate-nucleotide diphosphorylase (carboxylating) [Thermoplasmata archaeon HGW-Thermoplasmata-1]